MNLPEQAAGPAFREALPNPHAAGLHGHWLNVAAMLADVAFETDLSGRFTAFGQGSVLGIPVARLIGRNIADFCKLTGNSASAANSFSTIFATLSRQSVMWRGVATMERADGGLGTYQIFLAPRSTEKLGNARTRAQPNARTRVQPNARTRVQPNARTRAQSSAQPSAQPEPHENGMLGAYGMLVDLDAPELQMPTSAAGRATGMLDPQTGLWSASAFAEETGRRFDRLDVEGVPGTLILIGFNRTPVIGHNAVALRLTQELRDIIRPTDILGRINATTFGLWCDGMDDLTGAERAARFCQRLPSALPGNPCISVGLVARWPGNMEDPQALIAQARTALQHADKVAQEAADAGSTEAVTRGTWRVWNSLL